MKAVNIRYQLRSDWPADRSNPGLRNVGIPIIRITYQGMLLVFVSGVAFG